MKINAEKSSINEVKKPREKMQIGIKKKEHTREEKRSVC